MTTIALTFLEPVQHPERAVREDPVEEESGAVPVGVAHTVDGLETAAVVLQGEAGLAGQGSAVSLHKEGIRNVVFFPFWTSVSFTSVLVSLTTPRSPLPILFWSAMSTAGGWSAVETVQ